MSEKKQNTYHCCVDVTYTEWVYVDADSEEEADATAIDMVKDMHPPSLVLHNIKVDSIWME
jgi:hypothetical protein